MTFQRKFWLQLGDLCTKDGNDSNMVSISLNLYYIINFTAFQKFENIHVLIINP